MISGGFFSPGFTYFEVLQNIIKYEIKIVVTHHDGYYCCS